MVSSSKRERLAASAPGNLMSNSPASCTNINMLPVEMKYRILEPLSLASLRSFQFACKSSNSLISSDDFLNHRRSIAFTGDQTVIARREDNRTVSLLDRYSLELGPELNFPYGRHIIIIGCGGGIVCVAAYEEEMNHYFWNPETDQSKQITLPPPDQSLTHEYNACGYDITSEDFKLVRVVGFPFAAKVCSTKNNSWRNVAFPINGGEFPFRGKFTVCVDGFLCWNGYDSIIAFDLHNEEFNIVTELPVIYGRRSCFIRITTCNDSFGMVYCNKRDGRLKLWELDDTQCLHSGSGIKPSWTHILSIIVDVPVHFVHSFFNDHILLVADCEDDKSFWLVNCLSKIRTRVPVSNYWGQIYKYKRSSVSIPGSTQVERAA